MWQQYRKTFAGMQVVILTACVMVYYFSGHSLVNAAMSFVIMQLGSILGARWAVRLKTRIEEKQQALPLHGKGI